MRKRYVIVMVFIYFAVCFLCYQRTKKQQAFEKFEYKGKEGISKVQWLYDKEGNITAKGSERLKMIGKGGI